MQNAKTSVSIERYLNLVPCSASRTFSPKICSHKLLGQVSPDGPESGTGFQPLATSLLPISELRSV